MRERQKVVFSPALPAGCWRVRRMLREETVLVRALVLHGHPAGVDSAVACGVVWQGWRQEVVAQE